MNVRLDEAPISSQNLNANTFGNTVVNAVS